MRQVSSDRHGRPRGVGVAIPFWTVAAPRACGMSVPAACAGAAAPRLRLPCLTFAPARSEPLVTTPERETYPPLQLSRGASSLPAWIPPRPACWPAAPPGCSPPACWPGCGSLRPAEPVASLAFCRHPQQQRLISGRHPPRRGRDSAGRAAPAPPDAVPCVDHSAGRPTCPTRSGRAQRRSRGCADHRDRHRLLAAAGPSRRRTATGEVYDMHAMTAAHGPCRCPATPWLRNRRTAARVVVARQRPRAVQDGRVVDLSHAAARKSASAASPKVEVRRLTHARRSAAAGWKPPAQRA